jgi:hypothetical protein
MTTLSKLDHAITPSVGSSGTHSLELSPEALPGWIGNFVTIVCRDSEAHPAAVLITVLLRFAAECKGPYVLIGEAKQWARTFGVVVGNSSRSRKGTSSKSVMKLFSKLKDAARFSPGPLSTGEGLIYAVRDATYVIDKKTGEENLADPGVSSRAMASSLTERLNFDESSSIHDRIKMHTNPEGLIQDTVVQKMIMNSLENGALREMVSQPDGMETSFQLISDFYQAVAETFPEAWDRGVNDLIANNEEFAKHVLLSLRRHLAGDWGDLCDEDRVANELALKEGQRLFSVYQKEGLPKIWIITEWDRSCTTTLFPEEY